ncbi:steroid binding [Savitreella phatthalungensis]
MAPVPEVAAFLTPTNIALVALLIYLTYRRLSRGPAVKAPEPIRPLEKRDYTPAELQKFNGTNDDRHILVAVKGKVYDVTAGAAFYGPQGPYSSFGGRDASRALALGSFDDDNFVDPAGPIDTLDNLDAEQKQALDDWVRHFDGKYIDAGRLIENKSA